MNPARLLRRRASTEEPERESFIHSLRLKTENIRSKPYVPPPLDPDEMVMDAQTYKDLEIFEAVGEDRLIQPTFLHEFPTEISPLARQKPEDPEWADRFELYAGGIEIANGFSELNDPAEQAEQGGRARDGALLIRPFEQAARQVAQALEVAAQVRLVQVPAGDQRRRHLGRRTAGRRRSGHVAHGPQAVFVSSRLCASSSALAARAELMAKSRRLSASS